MEKILISNNLHVNLLKQYTILILLQCSYHKITTNFRLIYIIKLIRTQYSYILIITINILASLLISNLVNLKLFKLNYYIINYQYYYTYTNTTQTQYQIINALNATKQTWNSTGLQTIILIYYRK